MLTTTEAADRLSERTGRLVSVRRVQQLIAGGQLKAKRYGRFWLVHEASVDAYQPNAVGRPRKDAK